MNQDWEANYKAMNVAQLKKAVGVIKANLLYYKDAEARLAFIAMELAIKDRDA